MACVRNIFLVVLIDEVLVELGTDVVLLMDAFDRHRDRVGTAVELDEEQSKHLAVLRDLQH